MGKKVLQWNGDLFQAFSQLHGIVEEFTRVGAQFRRGQYLKTLAVETRAPATDDKRQNRACH
jgi:hypothetical protein